MCTNQTAYSQSDDWIIIDPKESRTAAAFEKKDLIQKSALSDVIDFVKTTRGHIQNFIDELQKNDPPTSFLRLHDTILIDGERGTGKTSFLLSAVKYLCSQEDPSSPSEGNRNPPFNLGIIDPTLISTKENIFILVISKIKEYVDDHHAKCVSHEFDGKYQEWNEQLCTLSRGLCMQDGIGTDALLHEKWEDAQYIMQEGLSNAQSGLNLERNFHRFIQKSLEFLKKDCFILCFDDTDTDFSKGWPVLELLRKYFTTPQLIVLLSGDYGLYAKLVRINQWKLFDEHRHAIRHYRVEHIQKTIESLESQYLTKILPPNRRIILKNAWELLDHLRVKNPTSLNDDAIRIDNLFESFTALWYRYPVAVCRKIGDLFTHLPMRNIIHILHLISSAQTKNKTSTTAQKHIEEQTYNYALAIQEYRNELQSKGQSTSPHLPPPPLPDLVNEEAVLAVHSNMILIYYNNLINLGFAQHELNAIQWTGLFYRLSNILHKKNLMKNGASLLPANVMPQDGLDILLLSGIYTSAILADIRLIFDYYIRVLMVLDLFTSRNGNEPSTQDSPQYKQLFSQELSLFDITTKITNFYISEAPRNISMLQKLSFDPTSPCCEEYTPRLLYNCTTHIFIANGTVEYYFSPFNAIALLALSVGSTGDFKFEIEKYTMPHTNTPLPSLHNHNNIEIHNEEIKTLNLLSEKIHHSSKDYHNPNNPRIKQLLPLYMHHEIWTDFVSKLDKLDKLDKLENQNCKDIYKLLDKTYNAFIDSIEKIERRHFNYTSQETPLSEFIKKNALIADIKEKLQSAQDEQNSQSTPDEPHGQNTANGQDRHDGQKANTENGSPSN